LITVRRSSRVPPGDGAVNLAVGASRGPRSQNFLRHHPTPIARHTHAHARGPSAGRHGGIEASVGPPDLYPGGPELRLRHRDLVALDDVREPIGFREGTLVVVRKLNDLRHLCFAAISSLVLTCRASRFCSASTNAIKASSAARISAAARAPRPSSTPKSSVRTNRRCEPGI
jgi:hypothetical protein